MKAAAIAAPEAAPANIVVAMIESSRMISSRISRVSSVIAARTVFFSTLMEKVFFYFASLLAISHSKV